MGGNRKRGGNEDRCGLPAYAPTTSTTGHNRPEMKQIAKDGEMSNEQPRAVKAPKLASNISSKQTSNVQPHPTNTSSSVGTGCETGDGVLERLMAASLESCDLIEQQSRKMAALASENRKLKQDSEIRKRLRQIENKTASKLRVARVLAEERAKNAGAKATKLEAKYAKMSNELSRVRWNHLQTTNKMAHELMAVRRALKKKEERVKKAFR